MQRTRPPSTSTSPSRRPTSSLTRRPQPYSSSSAARSRWPSGPAGTTEARIVLDLLDRQHARQLLRPLGRAQQGRGIVLADALADEVGVEGAHGRRAARHARRRAVAAGAGEVGAHVVGRRRARRRPGGREGRGEGREVAAVGGHGVRAEPALVAHVVEELGDQRDRTGRVPQGRSVRPPARRSFVRGSRAAPGRYAADPAARTRRRRHVRQIGEALQAHALLRRVRVLEADAERERRQARPR